MSGRNGLTRGQFVLSPFALAGAGKAPHVVFICGDHEYSGEVTLPLLARQMEVRYGWRATVRKSVPDQNGETEIPGLEVLGEADLAVFYLRWRRLPAEQLAPIEAYLNAGKPVMGLRTSSHAFHYANEDRLAKWNGWTAEVFGAPPGWGVAGHTHYGHQSKTRVRQRGASPLLEGVLAEFVAPSWLYHVVPRFPPREAKVLLEGEAIEPNKPAVVNPVAWTWVNGYGAQSFYTSLGHPGDFGIESFQRLLVNAMFWLVGKKQPGKWGGRMAIEVAYRGMVKG